MENTLATFEELVEMTGRSGSGYVRPTTDKLFKTLVDPQIKPQKIFQGYGNTTDALTTAKSQL
tara:strand:- start:230 stop:418 length:189 start_codon:yes stop_codon:yes gene_type:complete